MKIYAPERLKNLPAAVFFDIDNTLYAYDPAHAAAMRAVRDKAVVAFAIKPEAFDTAFAQARAQVKARLGHTAASHHRLLYLQCMLERMGLGSQVLTALDFEQTYWRTFLSHAVLFDHVKNLLDDLRLLAVPALVVTDLTAQIQFRKLVYFELDGCFDFVVTSEEAGTDKPYAVPFHLAREKAGLDAGDCIWMIGDDPAKDMVGARTHLNAVVLQKLHDGVVVGTGERRPDAAFVDFDAVQRLLKTLSAAG